jgi:hypothetical protein
MLFGRQDSCRLKHQNAFLKVLFRLLFKHYSNTIWFKRKPSHIWRFLSQCVVLQPHLQPRL